MPVKTINKKENTKTRERLSTKDILKFKKAEKNIISKLVTKSICKNQKTSKKKLEMTVANFPLAVHIAKKYYRKGVMIEDLIQVAAIGLIKGVAKFDERLNIKFATYVIPTIEGEVRHYLRDNVYGIRLSRKAVELNATLQKYKENFLYTNGREATYAELAKAFKMRQAEVIRVIETVRAHTIISLDAPVYAASARGDNSRLSRLEDMIGHDSKVELMIEQDGLHEALGALAPREQIIVKDRFMREMKQEEIAAKHNITQAQVSRILQTACNKLKEVLM
jgi:RNA polymerase sigma factor (sigma-70 family)